MKNSNNVRPAHPKPAWMTTGTFYSGGVDYNVPQGQVPYDPRLMQSGYYKTGDDERMTIRKNGQIIRLGPNSMMVPQAQPRTQWQQFMDAFQGRGGAQQPSNIAGVRG